MDALGPTLAGLVGLLLRSGVAPVAPAVPVAAGASQAESASEQAARIVTTGDLQRDLPGEPLRPEEPSDASSLDPLPPSHDSPNGEDRPHGGISGTSSNADDAAPGSIAQPLMIVSAVVLVLLAIWIFLSRRSAAFAPVAASVQPLAVAPAAAAPLDEPEELAAAGRFAEAVHRLLLRVLATLAPTLTPRAARGTTSREIVPRVPDPPRREALRELVDTVERSRFGARPIGAPEWQRGVDLAAAATHADPAVPDAPDPAPPAERRG
jgi:hypothetical protein